MPVFRMHSFVMMNKRSLAGIFTVMGNGMQQNGKSCLFFVLIQGLLEFQAFPGGGASQFPCRGSLQYPSCSEPVQRVSQVRSVEGPDRDYVPAGSVNDIYNDINFITHDTFSRYSLFHCIRSQTVDSRKVNETELLIFIGREAFFLFHCDTGPVSYL